MSSKFTHNICEKCWDGRNPDCPPYRVIAEAQLKERAGEKKCCFCGNLNRDGIFLRHDPESPVLLCRGIHEGAAAR